MADDVERVGKLQEHGEVWVCKGYVKAQLMRYEKNSFAFPIVLKTMRRIKMSANFKEILKMVAIGQILSGFT